MTKLEELARNLHNKWPYNAEAELQAEIRAALTPLLDACEAVAKHTAPYDRSLNWKQVDQEIAALQEQLSQWRSKK